MVAFVGSIRVGRPRIVSWRGREITTSIWKDLVDGPVALEGVNASGDDQADRRVHGGPDKAVYAYATEDYAWWAESRPGVEPGMFGENLTTTGIDLGASHVGDRWRVGSALLEVSQPRQPCFKLGIRMGDDTFPDAFEAAARPGAYLRIIEAGTITAGDEIVVEPTALPAVRVVDLVTPGWSDELIALVANDARVPEGWRRAAQRALGQPLPDDR